MTMKAKTEQKKRLEPAYIWTCIFLLLMFLVFPLYFQNNYINILEAKTFLFQRAAGIYCVGMLLLFAAELFRGQKKKTLHCFDLQMFFGALLLAGILIPLLLSERKENILWGYEGKLFGGVILLLCLLVCFFVSKAFRWNVILFRAMALGVGLVFVLTLMNRYGMDPLNMYVNLVETQRDEFLSTIGQINVVSNFVCIFLPFFMGLFLYSQQWVSRLIYGFCVYIGVMAGMSANSDSFFVAMALCVLYFLWFALESKEDVMQFLLLAMICCLSMLSLKGLNRAVPYETVWRKLQETAIESIPWWFLLILFGATWIWLSGTKRSLHFDRIRKLLFVVIGLVVAAGIGEILYLNITKGSDASGMLIFGDAWGTNRGYVWKRTIELYGDLPLVQKLFGVGLGGFKEFFSSYYEESVRNFGYYFTDAHNEFLQFLVTTGVMGVIGYFGMMVTSVVFCLKEKGKIQVTLAAVFLVWMGQGMFNNPLVFTTPYLFLFMGIARAVCNKKKEQ